MACGIDLSQLRNPTLTERIKYELFGPSVQGGFYDATNPSTMFQLSNGTGAVSVGSPVGFLSDLSGNGNHLVQATSLNRPVFEFNRLNFNGINHNLISVQLFGLSATNQAVSAIKIYKNVAQDRCIWELTNFSGSFNGTLAQFSGNTAGQTVYERYRSRGTTGGNLVGYSTASNPSAVLSWQSSIDPPSVVGRRDNVEGVNYTTSQGTGNYGDHLLYFGSRGGTTLYYIGGVYRFLLIGQALSKRELELAEVWCNEV